MMQTSRPFAKRLALTVASILVLSGCALPVQKPQQAATGPANTAAQPQTEASAKAPAQGSTTAPATADAAARATVPPAAYVGKMSLSPAKGPAGTAVTVKGTGLPADAQMDLVWNSVKGSWLLKGDANEEYHGRKFDPVQKVMAQIRTDGKGEFEAKFTVPDDYGFYHDVTVVQNGVIRNKAAFQVDMQVSISATSGPVGTPITLSTRGVGFQSLENSWMVVYDNKFTGWISAVTTAGRAEVVIPATGSPGKHIIQIVHGSFTVPYMNMQQSPSPDRPTWTFEFTVTDGAPVMPAAPEKQSLPVTRGAALSGSGAAATLDPASGPVGTPMTLQAQGLTPGQDVKLLWSRVSGNRVSGSGWEENSVEIGTAKVDANGKLEVKLPVPDDLGGPHTLTIAGGEKALASASFVTTPSALALSRSTGPAGTEFWIHLKGVGWTETANIYHVVYDNAYIGYACGFNSQGDVQVPMLATGEPGWHYIDLYPGIYKGKEASGVQNFRIPQLSYATDHPGEKLPAFRFAFYVTK